MKRKSKDGSLNYFSFIVGFLAGATVATLLIGFCSCSTIRSDMIEVAASAYRCGHTAGAIAYQNSKDLDEYWKKQEEDVTNYRNILLDIE